MVEREAAVIAGVPVKLSWGAIFGGTFVALGVWVLLYTLGMAIGLSAVDTEEGLGRILTPGIGTGLWSLITPLVALFIGGLVASRAAGIMDKVGGAIHGAVIWGLTTVLAVVLVAWGLNALVGAAVRVGQTAVGITGAAVTGAVQGGPDVAQTLGLNAQDLLAPINQQRQARGEPPVTPQQLQAALQDAANTAVRQGRLDRELLIGSLTRNTALNRQEAEQLATTVEQRWGQAQQQIGQVGRQVQQGVVTVANTTGRALWFLFFSQLLSLASAVLGASLGVTKRQRRLAAERVVPPTGPGAPVRP